MIWPVEVDYLLYYRRKCRERIRDWLEFAHLDQSWMRRRRMANLVWWAGELIRANDRIRAELAREMDNDQN